MVFLQTFYCPGKELISVCSVKAPLFDEQGKVIGIIGHVVQIDEIKDQLRHI